MGLRLPAAPGALPRGELLGAGARGAARASPGADISALLSPPNPPMGNTLRFRALGVLWGQNLALPRPADSPVVVSAITVDTQHSIPTPGLWSMSGQRVIR